MAPLHSDADMASQLERTLIGGYARAADLGEVLAIAGRVEPGDYDGWFREWSAAANAATAAADDAFGSGTSALAWQAHLRAAEYWRQSYFFLRQHLDDERVLTAYRGQRAAFRNALPSLPAAVTAVEIPFRPRPMSGYFFQPIGGVGPRPTVLLAGGFDSTAEEMHKYGAWTALALGWNVVTWDGPGQGGLLVEHQLPMRADYETVLTAVVDWTVAQENVDPAALFLIGRSLGGMLALRGATGEHRIAALVLDPGQHDFTSRFVSIFSPDDWQRVLRADPDLDAAVEAFLEGPRNQFFYGSRMSAMGASTFGQWLRTLATFTVEGRTHLVTCPTLITEGEGDFASQSDKVFDALACEKQLSKLPASLGTGGHCCGLGQQIWQEVAFGWLASLLGSARAG